MNIGSVTRSGPPRLRWPSLLLLGLAGCTSSPTGAKASGELGNGTFDYRCATASDPICDADQPATDFPDCLLEGGRFELGYTAYDSDDLSSWGYDFVYVEPASPTYFGGVDTLTALRIGHAAFVAYADDNVIDILHLDIVAPDAMTLRHTDGSALAPVVEVELGTNVTLAATASSTGCGQPGGGLPVSSESSDPSVAVVAGDESVLISGYAEGTATITVHVGALTQEVEVRVVAPGSTDATAGDSDTSTGSTETGIIVGDTTHGTDGTDASTTGDTDGTTDGGTDTGTGTDGGSTGVAT
jgi:hypothetical protein